MRLEVRGGSNRKYAYRSSRIGDKVRQRYVGNGADPIVQMLVRASKLNKACRDEERQAQTAMRSNRKKLMACFLLMTRPISRLEALLAIGPLLKQSSRGEAPPSIDLSEDLIKTLPERFQMTNTTAEINSLMRDVDAGLPGAAERLSRLLQAGSNDLDILRTVKEHANSMVLDTLAGQSKARRLIIEHRINLASVKSAADGADAIKDRNGHSANPVERLVHDAAELSLLVGCLDIMEHVKSSSRSKDTFWLKKANTQINSSSALIKAVANSGKRRRGQPTDPA
jgi:hypothetical protein